MSIKRWKLGWKRCDCVKCEAALTIEQTEEDCGWVRWGDHKEEIHRLKAEVERLTAELSNISGWGRGLESDLSHARVEISFLKAEVGRLKSLCDNLGMGGKHTITEIVRENASLKAEVERLRNAGDALYESEIGYYGEQILDDIKHHSGELCRNWNAAKEGKPSV